jgi:hypothetical protein
MCPRQSEVSRLGDFAFSPLDKALPKHRINPNQYTRQPPLTITKGNTRARDRNGKPTATGRAARRARTWSGEPARTYRDYTQIESYSHVRYGRARCARLGGRPPARTYREYPQ